MGEKWNNIVIMIVANGIFCNSISEKCKQIHIPHLLSLCYSYETEFFVDFIVVVFAFVSFQKIKTQWLESRANNVTKIIFLKCYWNGD